MWSQQQWELWRQPAAEAELPHDMVAAVVGVGDDDDVLILKWSGGLIVGQMDWTQVFSEHKSVETLQMTQTSSWGLARPQKNEHMGRLVGSFLQHEVSREHGSYYKPIATVDL
jgi:hypothetical protein